jgi:hypothetical protein
MFDVLAWAGSLLLAACAVAGAYDAWKRNYCSVGWAFLACWWFGELFLFFYAVLTKQWHLLVNYVVNLFGVMVMAYYNNNGGGPHGKVISSCEDKTTD